jgi:hypothetical protein
MAYSQDVPLVFSDMRFNIPNGYSIIGSTDLAGGMLAFRYGNTKGKDYIAFSNITNKSDNDYGCPVGEFYIELFTPSETTRCNKKYLDDLANALFTDKVKKVWRSQNVIINYLKSKNNKESLIFVCKKDGVTVQVDSDFLTEDGFQKMFADLLEQ